MQKASNGLAAVSLVALVLTAGAASAQSTGQQALAPLNPAASPAAGANPASQPLGNPAPPPPPLPIRAQPPTSANAGQASTSSLDASQAPPQPTAAQAPGAPQPSSAAQAPGTPSQQPPTQPAGTTLPPAGAIPTSLALDVTGTPAADPAFLTMTIRDALDRAIRPTLRPGSSIAYGAIVPWPLFPLAAGSRAAVNVAVSISSDAASTPVSAVTTVDLSSVAVPPAAPSVLFLSDDPEYLQSEGLVFRGDATPDKPARLYYYHSDIGIPHDVDVVLTATAPARAHVIASKAGPDLDVMSVGHTVSRDFLRYAQANEGTVADIEPGKPYVVRHALILQGEVAAGAVDVHVLSGTGVAISVISSVAGGRPEAYLNGPRIAYDGHHRHGAFDLSNYGNINATYTVGGPATAIQYGGRAPTPHNVNAADDGHDYGDYGVIRQITFTLTNPTDTPQVVYLYEKPLGGPVRGSFVIDGQLKELDCARLSQPYSLSTYQLPAHWTGVSTTLTMPDGGSFYPVELGATDTQPVPNPPPVGAPDGCSPKQPAFPDQANIGSPSAAARTNAARPSNAESDAGPGTPENDDEADARRFKH